MGDVVAMRAPDADLDEVVASYESEARLAKAQRDAALKERQENGRRPVRGRHRRPPRAVSSGDRRELLMLRAHETEKEVAKAVVIAGLSALVVRLVEWGVETVKARTKRAEGKSESEGTSQ